jgi:hypothetical protein
MAAVLDRAGKGNDADVASQVDEQLAQATSRIRAHDLTFGALVLLALLLCYATVAVVLDKYLNLPEWVRQGALGVFLLAFGVTASVAVIRPLRKRINPLYAAKQVESTIEDAKNSVTGYVDAQEKGNLNPTVRAALAARAARAAADADVNRAVDHRSLLYLGAVSIVLVLTLVVLFFVFRPAQFKSLIGRAFAPFTAAPIVSQTQLTLTKPDPAEPTITTGQSIIVGVHVDGKMPRADGPNRVRLLVRNNPDDPNYEELPMVPAVGATARDWELRVPDYLVQNGFWYKVVGGDTETPEYKVTVRSLPMVTEVRATYEYPKYLRRASDTGTGPDLQTYRGTAVALVARTNREVRTGVMLITPGGQSLAGTPVADKPDSLMFRFKIAEEGKYQIAFTSAAGETSSDVYRGAIKLYTDLPPTVVVTKPETEETTEPSNGQLAVDAKIGDDFGIDTVTLKMRLLGPVPRPLPDAPYPNGKSPSFRRAADGTFPTDLDYKGSVDLAKVTRDAAGRALKLEPGAVIEYWLEATDNCTEPAGQVGKSVTKRLRLGEPKTEPAEQQNQTRDKDARRNEEKKHNDQQEKKFEKEKREPSQKGGQPNRADQKDGKKDGNPDAQPGENGQQGGNPDQAKSKPEDKNGADGNQQNQQNPGQPQPKQKGDGTPGAGTGEAQPDPKSEQPKNGEPKGDGTGKRDNAAGGDDRTDADREKEAKDLADQLKRDQEAPGSGKAGPNESAKENPDQAGAKQPPAGDAGGANGTSAPKPEPNQPNAGEPNKGNAPAEARNRGETQKPEEPSASKPPAAQPNPMDQHPMDQKGGAASEPRDEPKTGTPGTDKTQPKQPPPKKTDPKNSEPNSPDSKNPEPKQDGAQGTDAASGAKGKGAGEKPGEPGAQPANQKDAAGAAGGPKPPPREPSRGADKPDQKDAEQPEPSNGNEGQPSGPAGDGKAKESPPAAGNKGAPPAADGKSMDSDPKGGQGANEPKGQDKTGAAERRPDKGNQAQTPKTDAKGDNAPRGGDKPQAPRAEDKNSAGAGDGTSQRKLDETERKELEQAANDLTSPDAKRKEGAREKLDKAVGKDKREELEKLGNDLNSPDDKTRDAARQKLEQMKKDLGDQKKDEAKGGKNLVDQKKTDDAKGGKELTEQQKKDLAQAANDLQSGDENKKRAAREKLDKMIGEQNRKEVERLGEDLKSDDPAKRDAAQKKVEDLKKKLGGEKGNKPGDHTAESKGNQPTAEEANELMKKAQDLNSPDEKTRADAEKALDDKIGEQNRKQLQEELKNQKPDKPKDPEELKRELEKKWQAGRGGSQPLLPGTEDDKDNRLKAAELQLEQLEKNKEWVKDKKGWTDAEYDKFMKGLSDRVERMRTEARNPMPVAPAPGEASKDRPLTPGGGGKVESKTASDRDAGDGGRTVAPAGFEDARKQFQDLLKKKR